METVDGFLPRVEGSTSSRIAYEIVDPRAIRDGNRFRITFEDTLIAGSRVAPDTLTTKTFSLWDLDAARLLIARSEAFKIGREFPPLDDYGNALGFSLLFFPEDFVRLNTAASGWNNESVYPIALDP